MHEDLTSYDCIVFNITVYPHNINYKIINITKLKIWFQLQFNYPIVIYLSIGTAFLYSYLFICIYIVCIVFLLYYISTSHTCSLSLGQRGKCTVYICTLLCTLLCTVQFAGLTSPQLHLKTITIKP